MTRLTLNLEMQATHKASLHSPGQGHMILDESVEDLGKIHAHGGEMLPEIPCEDLRILKRAKNMSLVALK